MEGKKIYYYPSKPEPIPSKCGLLLFVDDLRSHNNETLTVSEYQQAWSELTPEKREEWNSKGEVDSIRYQNEVEEWDSTGGGQWNKKMKIHITEKGVQPIRNVADQMRKIPGLTVHPFAGRLMTSAVELFVGTMAREIELRRSNGSDKNNNTPNQSPIKLMDIHKLIYEEDFRFGFLKGLFSNPDTLKDFVDEIEENEKVTTIPDGEKKPKKISSAPKKEKEKKPPKMKVNNRPKISHTSVQKYYESLHPGKEWSDELKKEPYLEQYAKIKAAFIEEEEKWKVTFPEEWDLVLKKRESDRERSKKRKELLDAAAAAEEKKNPSATIPIPTTTATTTPTTTTPTASKSVTTKPSTTPAASTTTSTTIIKKTLTPKPQQTNSAPLHAIKSNATIKPNLGSSLQGGLVSPQKSLMMMNPQGHVGHMIQNGSPEHNHTFMTMQNQQPAHLGIQAAIWAQQQKVLSFQQQQQQHSMQQQQQQGMNSSNCTVEDDPTLPMPWKKCTILDEFGAFKDCYFWNLQTGTTTWNDPREPENGED